jgi:hypothetical protein
MHAHSTARHIIGLVLAVLTIPVVIIGLIDPLEGGVAMLVAGALVLVTWLVSRIPVPRLEWIAWTATTSLAVVTVAIASVLWSQGITQTEGLAWWMWGLIGVYRIGVLVTLAGGVQYIVRHVRALRHREAPGNGPKIVHA